MKVQSFKKLLAVAILYTGCMAAGPVVSQSLGPPSDGETVVLVNHFRAADEAKVREFLVELRKAVTALAKQDPIYQKVEQSTRALLVAAPAEGSFSTIWLMDPWVGEASYDYGEILVRALGDERAKELLALVSDQDSSADTLPASRSG